MKMMEVKPSFIKGQRNEGGQERKVSKAINYSCSVATSSSSSSEIAPLSSDNDKFEERETPFGFAGRAGRSACRCLERWVKDCCDHCQILCKIWTTHFEDFDFDRFCWATLKGPSWVARIETEFSVSGRWVVCRQASQLAALCRHIYKRTFFSVKVCLIKVVNCFLFHE